MGKKNRKQQHQHHHQQQQQQQPLKKKLCFTLTDKTVQRTVEEIWEKTSKWCGVSLVAPPNSSVWEEYDRLTSLVEHLKKRQGSSPVPLPPREKGIDEFKTWLKQNGAVFDKVDLCEFPGNEFGLRVIDKIEEAEKVLQIPESVMLSWNEVLKPPLHSFVKTDPLLNAMPNLALAIVLLNERYNPDSFWRPYINVLPQTFDIPLFYTKEELQELNGSPVLVEAVSQLRNISRLYSIIYQRIKAHNDPELFIASVGFNYDDFVWAVSCIMSRQNKIPSKEGGDNSLVLIPFWDMANHSLGKILTDYDVNTKSCVCYSMSQYTVGEEFMIFYGQRPNSDLFLNQGFTYENNPYDSLKIPVGLSRNEDSVSRQLRHKLLETVGIQVPGQFPIKGGETPFSPELMAFTRVFTASLELLEQWKTLNKEEIRNVLMSDELYQRDIKALEFLENRCSLLLHPYKTTLEEDTALLCDHTLPYRVRCVIVLRANEKRILKNASQLAHMEKEKMKAQLNRLEDDLSSSTVEDVNQTLDTNAGSENQSLTLENQSFTHGNQSSNCDLESRTLIDSNNIHSLEDQSIETPSLSETNTTNICDDSSDDSVIITHSTGELSNLDLNSVK